MTRVHRVGLTAALLTLVILAVDVREVRGQSPVDSLVTALASADFNDRHAALRRINDAFADPMPIPLVTAVLALLDQEAATVANHEGDEDYGEYLMELAVAGAHTNDPRANDGLLRLGGVEASGAVARFIASQGRAVFATLDAYAAIGHSETYDALEVYALMLGRFGGILSRADSAQVLAAIMAAAGHPSPVVQDLVLWVSAQAPFPFLLPVVNALAQEHPTLLQIKRTLSVLPSLAAATPSTTLLRQVQLVLEGICAKASGSRIGSCQALQNALATALRHLEAGRMQPARNVLNAFAARADTALQQGDLTSLEHHLLADTARQVAVRP